MKSTLPDLLILDTETAVKQFQETIKELSDALNKDGRDVTQRIMPLLDNVFCSEMMVGALAYDLWSVYKDVPKEDMERYTDAVIVLGNDLVDQMNINTAYNTDGNSMYAFSSMLGNVAVLSVKEMEPSEYQVF